MKGIFNKILGIYVKYKEVINYLIFGVLTTLVNYISYILLTRMLNIGIEVSTAIAWLLSVIFAYITNKIFVFESKTNSIKELTLEIASFMGFRVLSGVMDILFMYIFVTILGFNDLIIKLVSNVIIVIINYIFSKLFIFRNKEKKQI